MRVIFLDIDGVICTKRALTTAYANWFGFDPTGFGAQGWNFDTTHLQDRRDAKKCIPGFSCDYWPFDQEAVNLMHRIVRENDDIRFVISSSWRVGETLESLDEKLHLKGLQIPIIDFTKSDFKKRGEQINDWLEANREKHNVTQFCVIDDEVQYDIIQYIPNNCVETEFTLGFTETHFREAMNILRRP